MKTLLILILAATAVWAEDKPTVDVYLIRKFDRNATAPHMPEVILEVANTTKDTFYVKGEIIASPVHYMEALRGDKWLRIPNFICGTGSSLYPLRPGAKMLVTVYFPWEERQVRYRFFFWTSEKQDNVISVRSRAIDRKELGDLTGTIGELDSNKKLDPIETDEELNKREKDVSDLPVPFK